MCLRSRRRSVFPISTLRTLSKPIAWQAVAAAVLMTLPGFAQQQPPTPPRPEVQSSQPQAAIKAATVTISAGTRLALVLTQPIQTRYTRRGDDIYAQVTNPVNSGNEVVIPPGTFVQGNVDKLERQGGRGELRLQSMSITFPDGYVAPIPGPITLESDDGYAIKDPGPRRGGTALAVMFGSIGLGALIGHSIGKPDSSTTSAFPPGCTGPPPFCSTVTTPAFGTKGEDTAIGASVGMGIGTVTAVSMLFSSRNFYLEAGAPVRVTLQHAVTLQQDEVAEAVRESAEHPAPPQPVAPLPLPPVYPDTGPASFPTPPPSPGTPPTVIPGPPGPNGVPGPPIIVPGTPPGA